MKPKGKVGRPRNKTVDKVAAEFGVTTQGARDILAEAQTTGEPLEDLKAARLRKLKLEGDKLEYLLEVTKGKHIPKEKVEEDSLALGMAVKAQLYSWAGALPGRLEGLTAAQMVPIFQTEIEKILNTLAGK